MKRKQLSLLPWQSWEMLANISFGAHGRMEIPAPLWLCASSCSVVPNSLRLHEQQPARLLCPWGFSRQEYWSGLLCPPPGDLPDPGIEPRSPALRADSLPSEPPGKPKKTGVGSLSLLQGNFLTQNSNRGSPALQVDSLLSEPRG